MPYVTARFAKEISGSHEVYAYVDVVSTTGETVTLVATDGSVNVDRTAQFRRTATIACIDPTGALVPSANGDLLTPFGTEVRPYRGVRYHNPDGTTETEVQPLGVFRLSKTTVIESSTGALTISLEMTDRSRTISRDKFTAPYTIAAGTNLLDAILLIVGRTFSNLHYDTTDTALLTPAVRVYDVNDDPWQACVDLATSMAAEVYFDATGTLVVAPPPDLDTLPEPVFTYIENQNCIMTDLQAVYTDDPGYNGVVFTGATIGTSTVAVRATAWDNEPTSPTYYLGPYGQVPMSVQDTTVTTTDAAQAAADAQLRNLIGFAAQITVSGSVNPAYEGGDAIQVVRGAMNVAGYYSIDAFNVPLHKDGTQNVVLKAKQSVSTA